MRYLVAIMASLILIAGLAVIVVAEVVGPEVELRQDLVQTEIEKKLPIQGRTLGMNYKVDAVSVEFRNDGRFNLMANVEVDVKGRSATAKALLSSGLSYKRHSGSFYLESVTVDSIEWLNIETKESDKSLFNKALEGLGKLGVSKDAMKGLMATYEGPLKQSLKDITEDRLASVRVYKLDDAIKGTLIARALKDVSIEQDKMLISLSWAELFTRIVVYLVFGFIVILGAWFMVRNSGRASGELGFTVVMEGIGAVGGSFID